MRSSSFNYIMKGEKPTVFEGRVLEETNERESETQQRQEN